MSLIAPRIRFKVFGFSNLLVMYFVRNLHPLSFPCVNLSMYELNFFIKLDFPLNINDRHPPTTDKANRKKTRVNISNLAFREWVLLPSGICRAVDVTTIMLQDDSGMLSYLNKDHRLPTI